MRKVPLEKDRQLTTPEGDDQNYYVTIVGELTAKGKGLTEDAAHRAAEQTYDRIRADLVRGDEDFGTKAKVELIAEVLYAYHHSMVVNQGRGLPPGTPLPRHASPVTMDHFRREAELWIAKVEDWREADEPDPYDTSQLRGVDRR